MPGPGSKPGTSAALRRYWADPLWRARQIGLLSKKPCSGRRKGRLLYISVGFDQDLRDKLAALAQDQKTSIPELIRTYVTWGLETEESYD